MARSKNHTVGDVGRPRMIIDLPDYLQMAVRLRAVKTGLTTGNIIGMAIENTYRNEIAEAQRYIAVRKARHAKAK